MRKLLSALLSFSLLLTGAQAAYAANEITVKIDGMTQIYDQPPEIINGSTMVPLRGIFESLGATIAVNGQDIEAVRGQTVVKLTIGADTATVDGKSVTLAQKSVVINGRTLVPLRFVSEALGALVDFKDGVVTVVTSRGSTLTYDVTLEFPGDRYPETAAHIKAAIAKGESSVCTIDRDGADANRDDALSGIPTKDGYDRDEWPMAMCEEGGEGADVAYVESSDNRGSGAWVGNALEDYPDGTRVLFVIVGSVKGTVDEAPKADSGSAPIIETPPPPIVPAEPITPEPTPQPTQRSFANCTEARAAGAAPLYFGEPGYSTKLDRDKDGVACE